MTAGGYETRPYVNREKRVGTEAAPDFLTNEKGGPRPAPTSSRPSPHPLPRGARGIVKKGGPKTHPFFQTDGSARTGP